MAVRLTVLALVALIAAACGTQHTQKPTSDITLAELRRPSAPQTYFVGTRFRGLPLTGIVGGLRRTTFIYGTCTVHSGQQGCAPPLQVQHWSLRERPPWKFPRTIACKVVRVHGNPAAAFASSGGLEVYLGNRVVVVFARTLGAMRRAAVALRPVRPGAERLPAAPRRVARYVERRCS